MSTRSQHCSETDQERTQDRPDWTTQGVRGDQSCKEKPYARPNTGGPHLGWLDPAAPTRNDRARSGAQQSSNHPTGHQSARTNSVSHDRTQRAAEARQ